MQLSAIVFRPQAFYHQLAKFWDIELLFVLFTFNFSSFIKIFVDLLLCLQFPSNTTVQEVQGKQLYCVCAHACLLVYMPNRKPHIYTLLRHFHRREQPNEMLWKWLPSCFEWMERSHWSTQPTSWWRVTHGIPWDILPPSNMNNASCPIRHC